MRWRAPRRLNQRLAPPAPRGAFPFGGGAAAAAFGGAPSTPGSAPPGSLGAGLAQLSQPLKLRLSRAPGSRLRDVGAAVVLVEPLATVSAVEDFLWGRVQPPPPPPPASTGGGGAGGSGVRVRGSGEPTSGAPAPSRDRPIPAPPSDRRVTRAAARAAAAAAGGDVVMGSDAGEEDDDTEDDEMHDATSASDDEGGGGGEEGMAGPLDFDDDGDDDEDVYSMSDSGGDDHDHPGHHRGDMPPPSSYAAAAGGRGPRLALSCRGVRLDPAATVFQALTAAARAATDASDGDDTGATDAPRRLWADVQTVVYDEAGRGGDGGSGDGGGGEADAPSTTPRSCLFGDVPWPLSDVIAAASPPPPTLTLSPDGAASLAALAALYALNAGGGRLASAAALADGAPPPDPLPAPPLTRADFVNPRLAPKLALALKDVLSVAGGALPRWAGALTARAPFLLPADLRARYVRLTCFGLARALAHLQDVAAADAAAGTPAGDGLAGGDGGGGDARVGRLARHRVRVDRARVLDAAERLLAPPPGGGGGGGDGVALLEVEFAGEPGTGLGPTLEFFTLTAHALQAPGLGMWRGDRAAPGAGGTPAPPAPATAARRRGAASPPGPPPRAPIDAPLGLFPAPLPRPNAESTNPAVTTVLARFTTLGRLAGRALRDGRLLDLTLARPFWGALRGRRLSLADVRAVDDGLGRSLEALAAAAAAVAAGTPATVGGAPLSTLALTWECAPGFPAVALGSSVDPSTPVTDANIAAYVDAVVDAVVGAGVAPAVAAFRSGFADAAPLSSLSPFADDAELEALLCGSGSSDADWTPAALEAAIRFDHGYTAASAPARHLVAALASLSAPERAAFLRFVTGCPRLPPGGLAALTPRLTVVRKHSRPTGGGGGGGGGVTLLGATPSSFGALADDAATAADADLPSVMTCANYVKLPPYSSAEVTRARLMYAVAEGQGAFELS